MNAVDEQRLRAAGFRLTPQRRAVLQALQASQDHPTADQVYSRVRQASPRVGLATVYRALALLDRVGLIGSLDVGSGRRQYDGNVDLHHHLICTQCGAVVDLPAYDLGDALEKTALASRFEISAWRAEFFGRCESCAVQAAPAGSTPPGGAASEGQ